MPRWGRSKRGLDVVEVIGVIEVVRIRARRLEMKAEDEDDLRPFVLRAAIRVRSVLDGHRAAALALARVLARAAHVAGLASALALARVGALARMLLGRRAVPVALGRVLAGAGGVAALAAAPARASVYS